MKKLLSFVFLLFCTSLFAEYQVYTYKACIKKIELCKVKQNGKYVDTYKVSSDTLTGYLVTVCCYPCGAYFGKEYPSWLYIQRKNDTTKTLWQMQVDISGGLFGKRVSNSIVSELNVYDLLQSEKTYLKNTTDSWVMMKTNPIECYSKWPFNYGNCCSIYKYGLLGYNLYEVDMTHMGFGHGGWKINEKTTDESIRFNMYIKDVSGYITGKVYSEKSTSFDPSNLSERWMTPIVGTFQLKYNSTMTEAIRGLSNWNCISSKIYEKMKFEGLKKEEYNEDLLHTYEEL